MLRPVVDASALRSVHDIVPAGEPRVLAARLLERTLLRLGRAGVVVERRLAPGLSRMHALRLYRLLGYARLGDYLTERLGMSLRRCQTILRLERALASLPRLARELEEGAVSVSKLEVAAAAATPATEATWLDRTKRLSLAGLREAARALAGADAAVAPDVAAAQAPAPAVAPASAGASSPRLEGASRFEQDEPGRVISFAASAPVVAIWHWTLDLVRRVAGQQEPAWRCAEFLAAEFLSGVPDSAGESSRGPSDSPSSPANPASDAAGDSAHHPAGDPAHDPADAATDPAHDAAGQPARDAADNSTHDSALGTADNPVHDSQALAAWMEAAAAVREALAPIGASADPEAILSERRPAGGERADSAPGVNPVVEPDAWELDARLRGLVRLRQSLAWRQGRLLAAFAVLRLHRELGFDTFDDWVGDRLAMSPRRARYLVSLDRRLRDLPLLADAYRRGLVSWCQARLLIRVVRPATQSRWIRYARQVTVRRLEDVIIDCEVSAANPSASATASAPAHIGASPLPPTEPSPAHPSPAHPTPAHPTTAIKSAPSGHSPLQELAPAGDSPLHTSARPLDLGSINWTGSGRRTWRRISFWCPLDVASLWDSALRAGRAAAGHHLEDWECFLLFVRAMRDTWENQEDPHWRRRYRTFERDGWRCKVPGCTSRSGLNEHHITFRSQQGGDESANLVTLCVGHHQQGLHEGHIRCFGRAPDDLWWDLGVKPGGEPLTRYFGDLLIKRRPFVSTGLQGRAVDADGHGIAVPGRALAPPARLASRAAPPPRASSGAAPPPCVPSAVAISG